MRSVIILGFVLLVILMIILVAAGAKQFLSLLVPLAVFPLLIGVGGRRKIARRGK
ncbi:MAG: hypothetical protein HKL81_03060 [Acidimicrobiaceae bacterium]|nr:hypothetical protein [Acidimicrobiaceae bacterium]